MSQFSARFIFMPLTLKRVKNQYGVFKANAEGLATGDPLSLHDSYKAANDEAVRLGATNIKCWDEYDHEYVYVPWTATTLKEALEAQAAQEHSKEVRTVAKMYGQLVDRVLDSQEVKAKGAAVKQLAGEFADWLDKQNPTEPVKSVPIVTEVVADHSVIKSLGNDRIGGYAVIWGDETKKDLSGQYFTPQTTELTTIFDTVGKLPWMYNHALDKTVKTKVAGVVDVMKSDSVGLWYEAQLKIADEYDTWIKKLLAEGKLKTSSQTFPSAFEYNKSTGEITRWPIVEVTGTPSPMEYRMPAIENLKADYAEVGSDFELVQRYAEVPTVGAEKAYLELELTRLQTLVLGD